jgi:hypothetical protein
MYSIVRVFFGCRVARNKYLCFNELHDSRDANKKWQIHKSPLLLLLYMLKFTGQHHFLMVCFKGCHHFSTSRWELSLNFLQWMRWAWLKFINSKPTFTFIVFRNKLKFRLRKKYSIHFYYLETICDFINYLHKMANKCWLTLKLQLNGIGDWLWTMLCTNHMKNWLNLHINTLEDVLWLSQLMNECTGLWSFAHSP